MTRFGALSVPNPDPPLMTISIRCVYNIPAASWVKIGGGELCGSVRPESGRIRGKQHPASEKGYKKPRIPSFPHGDLRAVPSNAQDEGEEEPAGAGSTPGSPAPMLKPAWTERPS